MTVSSVRRRHLHLEFIGKQAAIKGGQHTLLLSHTLLMPHHSGRFG